MKLLILSLSVFFCSNLFAQAKIENPLVQNMAQFKQIRIQNDLQLSEGQLSIAEHAQVDQIIALKMLELSSDIKVDKLEDLSFEDLEQIEAEILLLFESQQINREELNSLSGNLVQLKAQLKLLEEQVK